MTDRNARKVRTGRVVSDKMDKTVTVAVSTFISHKLYGRTIRYTKKFKAHDENNECRVGDWVKIMETRPISKDKRWRVAKVLEKTKKA